LTAWIFAAARTVSEMVWTWNSWVSHPCLRKGLGTEVYSKSKNALEERGPATHPEKAKEGPARAGIITAVLRSWIADSRTSAIRDGNAAFQTGPGGTNFYESLLNAPRQCGT